MRAAFWLLIVSAALRVFVAVLLLATFQQTIDTAVANPPPGDTAAQVRQYAPTSLTALIVEEFVFAALWVVFAYLVRREKNWARVTLMVLVVLYCIFILFTGTNLYTLVSVLIALVAVGMLYLPSSRAYFAAVRERRQNPVL